MTIEEYNVASGYIEKLQTLENSIYDIKNILQTSDTAKWLMEIRPSNCHPSRVIDHKGLLPEILNMVLSKQIEEHEKLKKALEEI